MFQRESIFLVRFDCVWVWVVCWVMRYDVGGGRLVRSGIGVAPPTAGAFVLSDCLVSLIWNRLDWLGGVQGLPHNLYWSIFVDTAVVVVVAAAVNVVAGVVVRVVDTVQWDGIYTEVAFALFMVDTDSVGTKG